MKNSNLTPNPDPLPNPIPGPNPDPFPGPIPGPQPFPLPSPLPGPIPLPWPPDWWRCWRIGPVSGRYYGEMTTPTAGRYALDLRVDIDLRHANSPVMDRISGDFYQVYRFTLPGWPPIVWRVYKSSWIVDAPSVTWSRCDVVIMGNVRYWQGSHPTTGVRVRIPWATFRPAGPAEVTFTEAEFSISSYSCARQSNCFREVTLEIDICESVNTAPTVPSYDTNWHLTRPADLPQRTLTIEEAYREAGICMTINPSGATVIDDSAPGFTTWSPAELHDAMEISFSRFAGTWPAWNLWGLLAGTFDNSGVGGIMFDAAAAFGGAGEAPERQGFALFRNHQWFNNLTAGVPADQNQAWSMRHFLYTWVHEAGHAFNLLHSWNKNRPDSLSWMNYDWRYDARNGADSYWSDFRFRFDDEELIHMRHGDRASVIMGGDPWASGGHMETPPGAMADMLGEAPIELLIRSKGYFEFMEPVILELRVKNTSNTPLKLDTQLHPEFGGVIVYIRRPDGRTLEYAPIMCKLATPELKVLKAKGDGMEGDDRHSQQILLSYGSYGFYFDQPGEYLVRAVYQSAGDIMITSNLHHVRIGHPFSQQEERIAQNFFTYESGMALYLNGSSSPYLKKGMDTLEDMADRYEKSPVGAHLSLVLAQNLAQPFFRIAEGKLVAFRDANPEEALALTTRAYEQQKRDESTFTNITYHHLVRDRADFMATMGEKADAKKELGTLVKDLKKRGVNQTVLDEIDAHAKSL
jgi:hypothetical protein